QHLPSALLARTPPAAKAATPAPQEKKELLEVLAQCQWNRTAAATRLGMHRTTLWRKMRELGIPAHPKS
ncbi:MAG: helix-turn-helix domain-containing protein, partial [Deltaproteobacteria bacterium]